MLQTSPSGASPGILSLDNSAKNGAAPAYGDADGFSQEYDKQVKNIESSEQHKETDENKPVTAQAKSEASEKTEAKVEGEQAANDEGDEAANSEGQAANDEAEGGNNLPLEQMRKLAAEALLKAEAKGKSEEIEASTEQPLELVGEEVETQGELAEQPLAGLVAQPQQESVKSVSNQAVAAAVRQATGEKADSTQLLATDEVVTEELASEEPPELQLKPRNKGDEFASLLGRQSRGEGGGEVMQRGGRGFESLLNMPGRTATAAASIDTLSPTLVPLAGQGAASPLATPVPVAMSLATPMHQANWGGAVAERVVWMTNANIQEAEIQLNPRELGPIGIKVTVNNEQTHVSFVAQNATTREALEQAIPRLREMLSENGLQLGQSDVSQHSFKGRDGQGEGGDGRTHGGQGDGVLEGEEHLPGGVTSSGVSYVGPAGLDAFA